MTSTDTTTQAEVYTTSLSGRQYPEAVTVHGHCVVGYLGRPGRWSYSVMVGPVVAVSALTDRKYADARAFAVLRTQRGRQLAVQAMEAGR